MTTRRAVLTLAVTVAASTAGCLSRFSERDSSDESSDAVEIPQLEVQNMDGIEHEIYIILKDSGGEKAFRERILLEPGTAEAFIDPVSGAADYEVKAIMETTTAQARISDYTDADERCAIPEVRIRSSDELFIRYKTYEQCSE